MLLPVPLIGYGRTTLRDPLNVPPVKLPLAFSVMWLPDVPAEEGNVSVTVPLAPAAIEPTVTGRPVVVAALPRLAEARVTLLSR